MGAPDSGMQAAEQPTAESLLTALRTIKPSEREKHAIVLDYWLSIRGDKEFPPLHDLDPLEISDAGPSSILLELIGGGQDAEIRHLGEALKTDGDVQRIIDAPNPSLLSSIARKLPIVSISREFLAFEDSFSTSAGMVRCWVTLLPLSSCGSWVDYVYAFVSLESTGGKANSQEAPETAELAQADEPVEEQPVVADLSNDEPQEVDEEAVEQETAQAEAPAAEPEPADDPVPFAAEELAASTEVEVEPLQLAETAEPTASAESEVEDIEEGPAAKSGPGFSKILDGIANLTGFYGQGVNMDSAVPTLELTEPEPSTAETPIAAVEESAVEAQSLEPVPSEPEQAEEESPLELGDPVSADEPQSVEPDAAEQPDDERPDEIASESVLELESKTTSALEGPLQNQLAQVRAKAEEARQAQLRVTQALHESLSAAYDFALDAEGSPEEYLRLVEAQGVKIQLRAPMAPVARMAFDDVCDAATIRQFEAVLAWALKVELPRGALLERIEQAGGVSELLSEFSKAA